MLKKIACMAVALAMLLMVFTGCGRGKSVVTETDEGTQKVEVAKDVLKEIKGSGLDDEKMLEVIKEYYAVYNRLFEKMETGVFSEVTENEDGSISVFSTQPVMDSEGNITDETTTDEVFRWESVAQAYAYLYEKQQVTLEGTLAFDSAELIASFSK